MKLGYKQTEVGVIPDDWGTHMLLEVTDCLDNLRVPLNESQRLKMQGDFPYCGANGVLDYVCDYVVDDDIILMAEDGGYFDEYLTRPIAYRMNGKCWVNNHAHILKARKEYDQGFLFYSLVHKNILQFLASGTRAKLNKSEMEKIVVPSPPTKEEQSAIATALSDVDALLAGLDKLIAKKRDIKQAAMQQLLTGKTRLPGFDGEWEVKRLGDLASLKSGASITAERIDEHSEFPCYGGNGLRGYTKTYTHEGDYALIGRQGALCGNVVSASGKFFASEHALVVTPKSSVAIQWLAYILAGANLNQYSESSAQPGLSAAKLLVLEFNAPPTKEEQTAIAGVLSDMDAELEKLQARREKTRLLKQGMMQELLTGRTRLVQLVAQPASNVVPFKKPAEAKPTERKANVHFQRSVFAAEIVERLHNEPTFGHVKFEKLIYLAEHLCKVDIDSHYHRDAAGPYDNRALRSIDSQMERQQWFKLQKDRKPYRYVPMNKHGGHKQYFDRYFSEVKTAFDNVIGTFKRLDWERCEIVATLYEAWRDLLAKNADASDDAIVDQVLNHWHEAKKRIEEERWRNALVWMREKGFVPEGAV